MSDTPPIPKPSTGVVLARDLMDREERRDEREARERSEREQRAAVEHAATVAALERQAHLWQRTALALIVVLLVLVAGVVGVGVSGTLPGVGELHVESAPETP